MNKINTPLRTGLSVIEVLVSIVVALIGVFGVLAMIPFSVKQSQSGLDRDAATMIARNALARFEAEGYRVVTDNIGNFGGQMLLQRQLNWHIPGTPLTDRVVANRVLDSTGVDRQIVENNDLGLFCIDPLGITEGGIGSFPFNPDPVVALGIPTVNLVRPDGALFAQADARRLFRITDDLVFSESDDPTMDLNGPAQIFNQGPDGAGNVVPLNRQSNGTISWCAVVQPVINDPTSTAVDSYKFFVLVFKDRVTDPTDPESVMATALARTPDGANDLAGVASPLETITIDTVPNADLRRDDWVMLFNVAPPMFSGDPLAARTNIAFARVTNTVAVDLDGDMVADVGRLTLDGPDFDFQSPAIQTNVVHLRDVLSVYARTISLETPSVWNITP